MELSAIRLDNLAADTSKLDASANGVALQQQGKLLNFVVKSYCFCFPRRFA